MAARQPRPARLGDRPGRERHLLRLRRGRTARAYHLPDGHHRDLRAGAVTARPVTATGYDTFGDIAETKDADGNVTTYAFDGDGRRVSQTLPPYTPPGGPPITAVGTTVYDGDGLVTSTTDGRNNTTRYGYDQLGDRVTVTAPDTSV
ncbi:MAG TPA: hypothetical protein VF174_00410, partial [Micromonosporaceae bacterium]